VSVLSGETQTQTWRVTKFVLGGLVVDESHVVGEGSVVEGIKPAPRRTALRKRRRMNELPRNQAGPGQTSYLVIVSQHPDKAFRVLHGHLLDELLVGNLDIELEPV
jgi:hypothetical protein